MTPGRRAGCSVCGLWFGEGESYSSDYNLIFHMHLGVMGTTRIWSPVKRWERFPNGVTYARILATLITSQLLSQQIFILYFFPLIVRLLANTFVWVLFLLSHSLFFSSFLDFLPTDVCCACTVHICGG